MKIQVLAATMHQPAGDRSLLEKMNIQTDAIIANQCDRNSVEDFEWKGHRIKWLSFAERGVGLNRNNALMRADGDILLFADDDVVYRDGYEKIIRKAYQAHPDADVIIFNFKESRSGEPLHDRVTKNGPVSLKGVSGFATFMITAKRTSLMKKNIVFHRMFGGGACYSHGEDSIFLNDCVVRGLNVRQTTATLGIVRHNESTWYKGINEKHFRDKGALFAYLHPKLAYPLAVYHVVKHRDLYGSFGVIKAIRAIWSGISEFL